MGGRTHAANVESDASSVCASRLPRRDSSSMRILFLSPTGQRGGAERSLLDLMASLRAARPDWSLQLIVGEGGPLVGLAEAMGVATTLIPVPAALTVIGDAGAGGPAGNSIGQKQLLGKLLMAFPATVGYVSKLRRAIRAAAPEVVHSNGAKMHVLGAWATPRGLPLVWHIHDYVSSRPLMSRLLRAHARRCSAALAISDSVASDVNHVCGPRMRRVYPVHNAIDLKEFCPEGPKTDLDELAGMALAENGVVRIGLLATMARWKGQEVFLKAISMLPKDLPFRAYIVGGPLYRTPGSQYQVEELSGLAARLGISDRVGFAGFVDDPAAGIRSLDVVVHASTEPEPFGRVIVEGMACGRAVVASAAGGASELISDGVNALGHPPGDAAALARCLAELIANPGLRARLGKAGRETAERRFDRTLLASKCIPLYREVASGPS
jgi:glycosyltransferase involved in cell wall biosynthesis